jgi:hypothetical protein
MSGATVRSISFKRMLDVFRSPERRAKHLKVLRHDVLVSCVGSTIIFGFGDILAQNMTPSHAQKQKQAEAAAESDQSSLSRSDRLQLHEIEWTRASVVASQGFLLNGG